MLTFLPLAMIIWMSVTGVPCLMRMAFESIDQLVGLGEPV